MKIYCPVPSSNHFDRLNFIQRGSFEVLKTFVGYRLSVTWKKLPVEIDSINQPGDFPSLPGHQLVCTERAWIVLEDIVGKNVEALPLECSTGQYFILNVLDVLDAEKCLDLSRSVVKRFADGRIMHVKSYAFHEALIADKIIFQLRQTYTILVSQAFKDIVEQNSLQGLVFRQVSE